MRRSIQLGRDLRARRFSDWSCDAHQLNRHFTWTRAAFDPAVQTYARANSCRRVQYVAWNVCAIQGVGDRTEHSNFVWTRTHLQVVDYLPKTSTELREICGPLRSENIVHA